jgi:hypothetical protein
VILMADRVDMADKITVAWFLGDRKTERIPSPMKILFLDLDGVVRVPTGKARLGEDDFDFCQERIGMLSEFVEQMGVKIVISSDWRLFETRDEIKRNLSRNLAGSFHDDWMTPILGKRWKEIDTWLGTHPEVTSFAVVDDFLPHFEDCGSRISKRLVLCDTRTGITDGKLREIENILCLGEGVDRREIETKEENQEGFFGRNAFWFFFGKSSWTETFRAFASDSSSVSQTHFTWPSIRAITPRLTSQPCSWQTLASLLWDHPS